MGGKHVSLIDDDFPRAFSLVPSAEALVTTIPVRLRTAQTLQILSMPLLLGGLGLLEFIPLLGLMGPVFPLIASACLLGGFALLAPGLLLGLDANSRLLSAVNTYNRGLVVMRGPPPGLVP